MKKIINLSLSTIKKLKKLAKQDKRMVKPYIEKVIEDHVQSKEHE